MVQIIQIIAKSKLSCKQQYIDCCTRVLKSKKLDNEKLFKDYQNIETKVFNLENFQQITTQNFSIFKDNNEIIDSEIKKIESFKFSKNVEEIQKQLQINFNLLLQGHTSTVFSVAVTSDNKYIVSVSGNPLSGNSDNTIRI